MTERRARNDPRIAQLGPDILARRRSTSSVPAAAARGRPDAPIGDALLDQRIVAGLGTVWRAEACWRRGSTRAEAAARHRRRGAQALVAPCAPAWSNGAGPVQVDGPASTGAGRPCPRCGTPIATGRRATTTARPTGARRARGDTDESRTRRPQGCRPVAPGNTLASFEAALAAGVDMIEFDVLPEHRTAAATRPGPRLRRPRARDPLTLDRGPRALRRPRVRRRRARRRHEDRPATSGGHRRRCASRPARSAPDLDDGARVAALVRGAAPEIRLGWSVPKVRRDYLANPFTRPVAWRPRRAGRTLPGQAAAAMRDGESTP